MADNGGPVGKAPVFRGAQFGVHPFLPSDREEFFIENLLVRIHFIVVMIRWTGLAPWEFE